MIIRRVEEGDAAAWESMREILWPSSPGEHADEIARFFAGDRREPAEVFLAIDDEGAAVGFAEVSIRSIAEGCDSEGVAYLEGWYVAEGKRRERIGAALVAAFEDWGREQGCSEVASDCELGNDVSAAAHRSLGFEETARLICFRKAL